MIIEALAKRSLENPAVPLSSIGEDSDLWDTLTGGGRSSSGVRVTPKSAISITAVWRGINLISDYVGKIPFHLYKRRQDSGKDRDTKHPAYYLMRRKPNQYMNAFHLRKTLTAHAIMTGRGNGYAYIYRRGNASPEEVLPLNPLQTYPVRENGKLWYVTHVGGDEGSVGEMRKLRPEDVIHIKGLGFDGLVGYDVIAYMRESLGMSLGTRKFGAIYFKNAAALNVVLEHPDDLDPQAMQELRNSWNGMHSGLDNAHKTVILKGGMKANVISSDARKSQLVQLRQFEIREIANIIGIPPHKIGDTTRTAFASLEQENKSFLDDAVDPWLAQWEFECWDKLLTEKEKREDTHFFEFMRDAVINLDTKTLVSSLVEEVNNGLLSPDEARAIRNRPPIPDGEGEKFRMPANITIIGDEEGDDDDSDSPLFPPNNDGDEQKSAIIQAHRRLVMDTVQRMHKRVSIQAQKAAKKADNFIEWVDDKLESGNCDVFIEAISPTIEAVASIRNMRAADLVVDATNAFFDAIRDGLHESAECKPDELKMSIVEWTDSEKNNIADNLATLITGM